MPDPDNPGTTMEDALDEARADMDRAEQRRFRADMEFNEDGGSPLGPDDPSTRLRVGTSTGETLFAHHRDEDPASKVGTLVGMLKIPELAHQVCVAFNAMQDAVGADAPTRLDEVIRAQLRGHAFAGEDNVGHACTCGAVVDDWESHVGDVLGDALLPVVAGVMADQVRETQELATELAQERTDQEAGQ